MTTAGQPTGYYNQTFAVEFEVSGDLDGTTPSPNVRGSPPSGDNPNDPQNLFRVPVAALGLINPDYTLPEQDNPNLGTTGNRLVTYLWIEGTVAGDADASVDVVDATDASAAVQKNIGTFVGETTFYREGIFVPQGSMIRVRGMTGPVKVRLHIQYLNNARDLAAVLQAICCLDAPPDDLTPEQLAALTYDYRDTTANPGNSFVPAGTSATAHALRVRQPSVLSNFFIWGVVPPAALESVTIRLFRFTPKFFQLVTVPFVLDASSFVSSTKIDLTGNLLPVQFDADDILACSYVHVGPQQLQPLLTGWNFGQPDAAALVSPVQHALVWPPA